MLSHGAPADIEMYLAGNDTTPNGTTAGDVSTMEGSTVSESSTTQMMNTSTAETSMQIPYCNVYGNIYDSFMVFFYLRVHLHVVLI